MRQSRPVGSAARTWVQVAIHSPVHVLFSSRLENKPFNRCQLFNTPPIGARTDVGTVTSIRPNNKTTKQGMVSKMFHVDLRYGLRPCGPRCHRRGGGHATSAKVDTARCYPCNAFALSSIGSLDVPPLSERLENGFVMSESVSGSLHK